jgi:hypothetical protein
MYSLMLIFRSLHTSQKFFYSVIFINLFSNIFCYGASFLCLMCLWLLNQPIATRLILDVIILGPALSCDWYSNYSCTTCIFLRGTLHVVAYCSCTPLSRMWWMNKLVKMNLSGKSGKCWHVFWNRLWSATGLRAEERL